MIRRPPRSTLFPYDALPISRWTGSILRPALVKNCEMSFPRSAKRAMASAETGFGFLRLLFIEFPFFIGRLPERKDRKSTRLNSSHSQISYAVFCLKKTKRRRRRVGLRVLVAHNAGRDLCARPGADSAEAGTLQHEHPAEG